MTSLPVLVKGVLTAEDAVLAAEAGVDGVVVSNHGGRQLDGVAATLDALPEVVEARGRSSRRAHGRRDSARSGRRQGARARSAGGAGGPTAAVGLAAGGADGVQRVLELLRDELELALALLRLHLAGRGLARARRSCRAAVSRVAGCSTTRSSMSR